MSDRLANTRNPKPASRLYALYDERSFGFYDRKLREDPHFWPTADQLMNALMANLDEPLPATLEQHIKQRLDGTAKKKRGRRKASLSPSLTRLLVPILYRQYLEWLRTRERTQGLEGWRLIRTAHWWQGPPHERAARMVQARFKLAHDWRHVLNLISKMNS